MELIKLFQRLAFCQVVLGILVFCLAERNPTLFMVAGGLTVLSWFVVEGPSGRSIPRWVIHVGALAATLYLTYEMYETKGQRLVITFGHYTMSLQILMVYSDKSNREYAQLLALSMVQMISACIVGLTMIFGLLLIVYCILAMFTVLLFQLKMASDLVYQKNYQAAPQGERVSRPKSVVSRGFRWQFRLMASTIGIGCILIATAVFLLNPRSEQNRLISFLTPSLVQKQSGFRPKVSLDRAFLRNDSQEVILSLELEHSQRLIDYERESWLLRGSVLDRYNLKSKTWSSSFAATSSYNLRREVPQEGLTLVELNDQAPRFEARITLFRPRRRHIFTLDRPVAFFASPNLRLIEFNPYSHRLATVNDPSGALVYELHSPLVSSINQPDADLAQRRLPRGSQSATARNHSNRSIRKYAVNWPVQPWRVRNMTQKILDDADVSGASDLSICQTLTTHLQRNGFKYALEVPRLAKDQDPVMAFLFVHRQGHCELFASALAAMTRSIGLRSRVITGYRTGEYNRIGGYYIVRESNAHAWTEVEVAPSTWFTFDPSPPRAVDAEHRKSRRWYTAFRHLFEHFELLWSRSFVAYNQTDRGRLKDDLAQVMKNLTTDPNAWPARTIEWLKQFYEQLRLDGVTQVLAGVFMFFIVVGLMTLARILIVRRRRMVALQLTRLEHTTRRILAKQLRFYLTMLDILERHGYIRPRWQSPYGFAQELASRQPARFEPVVALTELFYEIRFGYRQLDQARRDRIRRHLRQLEEALKVREPSGIVGSSGS